MFNVGPGEMLLLAVLALLIFGPKRLPEIGRQAARALKEFRKAASDITGELKSGLNDSSPPERSEEKEQKPGPRV
jgi:sec-independent protein translocase protein TatA